jgi:hypothetical protein
VKPILTRYRLPPLPLSVVFQPARRPSLKINHFVSFFADAFARDPDISPLAGATGDGATGARAARKKIAES